MTEREYMAKIARLGCICCRELAKRTGLEVEDMGYAQVHHIREGQGGAQRAPNWLTIPLCLDHHTGTHGIHGDKGILRVLNLTELDLLALTIELSHDQC